MSDAGAATQASGTRKYPRTFGGLVASLVVCALIAGGVWALQNLNRGEVPDPAPAIDWKPLVAELREFPPGDFEILAPRDLPEGWKVTSARVTHGDLGPQWDLGMLTPSGEFLGLAQAVATRADFEEIHDDILATIEGRGTDDAGATLGWVAVVYGSASAAEVETFSSLLE